MSLTEQQKHKLKKFIKELDQFKGRHTELVSAYIPQGYEIVKIIQHLQQEAGTATNIKDSATRKNVIDALERMIQHLRLFKGTPEHGLAAFSGNVAAQQGKQDYRVWSIEPPTPLKTRIYRCDKEFVLDILREMLDEHEVYGLVVLDRRDAQIAFLKGKTIVPLVKTHSEVPGKFKAGGQSSQRFHRLIEGAAKEHFKKVAEYVKTQFLGNPDLKGIIVGGPGPTKYEFVDGGFITNELRKKIIGIKDLGYTGEFGLQELVDRSDDLLANEEIMAEKKIMAKFFDSLARNPQMVGYGEAEVLSRVQQGAVDTLLLSDELSEEKIELFEQEAAKMGTSVVLISTETREGVQLRDMGKIAALLRYEVHDS